MEIPMPASIHDRIQGAIDAIYRKGLFWVEAEFSSERDRCLDVIAQELMAARPELPPTSLDDWLANNWDQLSTHERSEIIALLDAYQCG